MVGRITPLKGHEVFLRALQIARRRQPRLRGLIVGDAPAHRPGVRRDLLALVEKLGLQEWVSFEDSRRDVQVVYARLDILVSASVAPESFGRTIVEAQACGVPVIASATGGSLDILEDGCTGQLFPPGDAQALAQIL